MCSIGRELATEDNIGPCPNEVAHRIILGEDGSPVGVVGLCQPHFTWLCMKTTEAGLPGPELVEDPWA